METLFFNTFLINKKKETSPIYRAPKINNNFLVRFPEEFDIETEITNKITIPTLKKGLFFSKWEDIIVEIYDYVEPSTTKKVYKFQNKKNFAINILSTDPLGETIENWEVHVKKIKSIDFGGTCSWEEHTVRKIKIVFQVKTCKIL